MDREVVLAVLSAPRRAPASACGAQVIIAGGGIGGLVLANALQSQGIDFELFEKTREYKPFGGPIQVQSNALAALEAINKNMCEEIMAAGTTTGNRVNGLKDGVTNRWYCQFDTGAPAQKRGLPLTRVVDRPDLQAILLKYMDTSRLHKGVEVVDFVEDGQGVQVTLSDGQQIRGDVLVSHSASRGVHVTGGCACPWIRPFG
jgi:zeaxanthin epoxidase